MNSVWGTVNYLAAGSTRNRLYVAPGGQRATARYEPRQVRIGDGRPHRGDLTLDAAGFTLIDHETSVPGLDNPAVLDGAYTSEALALIRALTGADDVVSLGWMLRRTTADRASTSKPPALPPAPDVHVDLHTTEIAHRYARVHARSAPPAPGTYRRAVWT
ncbi:MAG: CmcJ/NvfI family oxidoreductase, partial [Trebonia sp.]